MHCSSVYNIGTNLPHLNYCEGYITCLDIVLEVKTSGDCLRYGISGFLVIYFMNSSLIRHHSHRSHHSHILAATLASLSKMLIHQQHVS